MSTDTINQHYVPKAYLKQFANPKEQIWVYDKYMRKKFQTHIRNVAAERFFYDSEEIGQITGDKQFVEKFLCNAEGKFEALMRTLPSTFESRDFRGVQNRDKHFLSLYVALQMMRTKESRIGMQQQIEFFQALIVGESERLGLDPKNSPQYNGGDAHDLARELQAKILLEGRMIQEFAKCFYNHIWIIIRAHKGDSFLTSDEPLVMRPHVRHPWRSMSGIASEGIEIGFPLNPRYILVMCERTYFDSIKAQARTVLQQKSTQNTIYHNHMQIIHSNRYIFSATEDFSFVETVLNEEPHLAEPDRVRFESNRDKEFGRAAGIHPTVEMMRQAQATNPKM